MGVRYENHSLNNWSDFPLRDEDLTSPVRYSEADEDEMVDMGEGFNFFAKLFKINWPFGLTTPYSFFSLFYSA